MKGLGVNKGPQLEKGGDESKNTYTVVRLWFKRGSTYVKQSFNIGVKTKMVKVEKLL